MAYNKRYTGTFRSRGDVKWTVDLMEDGSYAEVGELQFRGDSPLEISWDETSKEEPLCGSSATLGIISPGDRTYADLYTINAGSIRMDVYRNDTLWWSGTLDPEFYEEPYSATEDYEVELTFSDFGILEREKWIMTGLQPLNIIIGACLSRSRIKYTTVNTDNISTQLSETSGKMSLKDLSVRCDNFWDEDGEAMTMKEVAEGVLQPLGLRMIQRAGTIYIYDLNGLSTGGKRQPVEWMSTDQKMGTDKVANDVKITFSPYAKSDQSSEFYYRGKTDVTDGESDLSPNIKNFYPDKRGANVTRDGYDFENVSFKIYNSTSGRGLQKISSKVKYFKIIPMQGGEDSEGVAYGYKCLYPKTAGNPYETELLPCKNLNDPSKSRTDTFELLKTKRIWLPKMATARRHCLRVKLELLADVRYNPFVEANDENNMKSDYDDGMVSWNMVDVRSYVRILSDNGDIKCAFDNSGVDYNVDHDMLIDLTFGTTGVWQTGESAKTSVCHLGYYDKTDLRDGCGIMGWKSNRQWIGMGKDSKVQTLKSSMQGLEDGQYIPYPPEGGWLEVTVLAGLSGVDYWHYYDTYKPIEDKYYDKLSWLLYKAPTIEVLTGAGVTWKASESDDIEYRGTLNTEAKDGIDIDTICGTVKEPMPTSKGSYFRSSDEMQAGYLYRAGRSQAAERLLIGSLYSQFAERHTKLSGTAAIISDGTMVLTDAMQEGKIFLLTGDVENTSEDTTEVTMTELSADEWDEKTKDEG